MSGHDKDNFNRGVRASITWLHDEAKQMNDPHARDILNNAAFHLGNGKRALIAPPDATLLALLRRAEVGLDDLCKLSAILGVPDDPNPPHTVRFDDGSEVVGRVADLAVEIVLCVNVAAEQAATVLADIQAVIGEGKQ